MFPLYEIECFPKIARGHGRRNTKSPMPCAKSQCRGNETGGHTYDRTLNYNVWKEEREFGEWVEDTLRKSKQQEVAK